MKSINKIINTLLVIASLVVGGIFIYGSFNQSADQAIDQSSVGTEASVEDLHSDRDELTNRYMKEIQSKLRNEKLQSAKDLKRAQLNQPPRKIKDEDWTHIPLEQQITKDYSNDDRQEITRSTAGNQSDGVKLNKHTAKEFIQAARRNGYHVILSETFEVISITPIRNTTGEYDSYESHESN